MKTLDELAIEHQTDRASVFTRTWGKPHDYARHYDKLFTPLRDQTIKLLEIGSASGEGVKMWHEYFLKGHIYGVDNVKDTCDWNTTSFKGPPPFHRFTFVYGDQSHDVFWKCFIADYGKDWDIIIDDGGHFNDGIITSFNELWPWVKRGGFYAVEDLGVAYGPGSIFVKPGVPNHMDWLQTKIHLLNTMPPYDIDSIYFSKELAVLRKAL